MGRLRGIGAAGAVLCALAAAQAAPASALNLHIVNESGRPPSEVFVDIAAAGGFEVEGFDNDRPRALSEKSASPAR